MPAENLTIFSNLKTFEALRTLTQKGKNLITLLEKIIDDNDPKKIKLVMQKITSHPNLNLLFQMSEHSPKIRTLFEEQKYESQWRSTLLELDYDLIEGTNVSTFQQLMGANLAFYHMEWIQEGYTHHNEAKKILEEMLKRGVPDQYISERAHTLPAIPQSTSISAA